MNKVDHFSPGTKWFGYNKGGSQRKWYGNTELVVNWENNGFDIKAFKKHRLELGEIEKTIYLLADEIEATKRRVNSLEHIMIPRFQATIKSINMKLEEMERENFVRMKMIRSTIEKNEAEALAKAQLKAAQSE